MACSPRRPGRRHIAIDSGGYRARRGSGCRCGPAGGTDGGTGGGNTATGGGNATGGGTSTGGGTGTGGGTVMAAVTGHAMIFYRLETTELVQPDPAISSYQLLTPLADGGFT